MRNLFLISFLFLNCLIRVDWDNNGKPERILTYEHPHEGNLTKAEIKKDQNPPQKNTDSEALYTIKPLLDVNENQSNNCVTKLAKCTSNCNTKHDITSSIFVWKIAIIQASRAICYDECYNDLGPGCDYRLKRIQY